MKREKFNIKNIILVIIFIILLSSPIIGILILWDFDISELKNSLLSFGNSNKNNNSFNYNFDIEPSEDELLTSSLTNQKEISHISIKAELIIIDSIEIEGKIVYGSEGEELLRQGFWHYPGSKYPGEEGISIIFGHRRYHLPPDKDTFFNLDKVKIGDRIEIKLIDGTWLEYTVINIISIDPVTLENLLNEQSDRYLLKLITCHPLGTSKERLIVTAEKSL